MPNLLLKGVAFGEDGGEKENGHGDEKRFAAAVYAVYKQDTVVHLVGSRVH